MDFLRINYPLQENEAKNGRHKDSNCAKMKLRRPFRQFFAGLKTIHSYAIDAHTLILAKRTVCETLGKKIASNTNQKMKNKSDEKL